MKYGESCEFLVIGAGLAGLSAAVELAGRGKKVLVCEQSSRPGGRASSFRDESTGRTVDNGQHLLMGCYSATREYLRTIGSENLAELQPALRIPYYGPGTERTELRCLPLPSILHAGSGLFRFSAIPFRERLQMSRAVSEIFLRTDPKDLDAVSAGQWLDRLHQSPLAKKYLWNVLCIGALNNAPEKVSALVFFRVLKEIFTGSKMNSCFLLPRAPLSTLLIDPAVDYIRRHQGEVRTNTAVRELRSDGSRIVSARLADGMEIRIQENVIAAVPWYAVHALCAPDTFINEAAFQSAPIIGIQIWLDREVFHEKFAAMIDTTVQWVFNSSALLDDGKETTGQHLSFVISGAEDLVEISKEELTALAWKDFCAVFPEACSAKILHSVVVKEKRATFVPAPGLESKRPSARTKYQNLFLAGDWTNTGFPATIEGAVRSGVEAAEGCW
jgi:squalene-associated FAD-dependent desaturase